MSTAGGSRRWTGRESGPFATELRAFVLTSQEELDAFEGGFISKRIYGNSTTLDRIRFDSAALLAAYYVWRPVRGDPLSVADLQVEEGRAVVKIELDEDPQGREYPYLFAPMIMVAGGALAVPRGRAGGVRLRAERPTRGHPDRHAQSSDPLVIYCLNCDFFDSVIAMILRTMVFHQSHESPLSLPKGQAKIGQIPRIPQAR